jgi:predicted  nucleic acid-binding Zn-ribbon protein
MSNALFICLECGTVMEIDETLQSGDGCCECPDCGSTDLDVCSTDEEQDQFNSDAEADADVLRSAGWGTDEDYGYYGDDSF